MGEDFMWGAPFVNLECCIFSVLVLLQHLSAYERSNGPVTAIFAV